MKHKYKIGQKVRVRTDLVVDHSYGLERFVGGMRDLLGKTVTISKLELDGKYFIKEDCYYWTNEMLEPTKKPSKPGKPIGYTRKQFNELLGYKISDVIWKNLQKEYERQMKIYNQGKLNDNQRRY